MELLSADEMNGRHIKPGRLVEWRTQDAPGILRRAALTILYGKEKCLVDAHAMRRGALLARSFVLTRNKDAAAGLSSGAEAGGAE